jgi:hypothetical protein
MNRLNTLFIAASGVFAALPGVSIIITNLGIPPEESKLLYGGLVETFSVLAFLVLWLNKKKIRRVNQKRITKISILLIITSLIFIIIYYLLFNSVVIKTPMYDAVFFPLFSQGELSELLTEYTKQELVIHYGIDYVNPIINSSSSFQLVITTIILIINYLLIFVNLISAFCILGIRINNDGTEN